MSGVDIEWADVFLRQTQFGPTEGSVFLQETRPEGKHYDYDVESAGVAAFAQTEFDVGERLIVIAGLRAEYLHYDYVNNMLDGNTRDDGTPCGFGGCLYTRPADRSNSFTDVAPKLGARWRLGDASTLYANLARGFRAPQMTELYRLQSGQLVSDLDSETIDSLEVGVRHAAANSRIDAAAFVMQKRDSVYRDSGGFNVSGGRSRHHGIEFAWDWQAHERWLVSLHGTLANHKYDFDALATGGGVFVSGRDIDTAPRWQGGARLRFDATESVATTLEWVSLGRYYLEPSNAHSYPGHDLVNLRASWQATDDLQLSLRLNNVADTKVADRADYAFGNYRYFPARGRELFVRLSYRP